MAQPSTYWEAHEQSVQRSQITFAVGERRIMHLADGTTAWAAWSSKRGEWILTDDPFSEVE